MADGVVTDADILAAFDRGGFDAIVKKLGKKWAVGMDERGYPGLFTTRRAAVDWATGWIRILREAS